MRRETKKYDIKVAKATGGVHRECIKNLNNVFFFYKFGQSGLGGNNKTVIHKKRINARFFFTSP